MPFEHFSRARTDAVQRRLTCAKEALTSKALTCHHYHHRWHERRMASTNWVGRRQCVSKLD